jgi:hypothetical protein
MSRSASRRRGPVWYQPTIRSRAAAGVRAWMDGSAGWGGGWGEKNRLCVCVDGLA